MEGGSMDMRDAIERELEKEMIREKIIAEEIERFHVLEAEVRRELMMGRVMMAILKSCSSGFPPSFMLNPQPDEIKEITTSLQNFGTGKPYGPSSPTLPEAKLKPPSPSLPVARGSINLNSCSSQKMEWRCPICEVSATSENGLQDHLAGKKHNATIASTEMKNLPKCELEWRCPICEVNAPGERGLQSHLAGKKHRAKMASLRADDTEKAIESVEKSEALLIKNSPECVPIEEKKKPSPVSLPSVAGSVELSKKKMEWRCAICEVCLTSESVFQTHLAGRKHKAKVAIIRKG